MTPERGRHNPRIRRIAMAALDAALLRGVVARWSYDFGLHGKLGVTRHEIQIAKEKQLPGPLVIAFASDFHAGPTTHPGLYARLFEEILTERPDVLLLGGDFVSCKAEQVDVLCEALASCKPRLGTYAVLGNHDLWAGAAAVADRLAASGADVLVNRNAALAAPFGGVSICGIDDPWTGSADLPRAFAGARPIRIFLTHSPDGLLLLGDERFDLGLAGHTHGGQIAFRDGTPLISAGGPLSRTHARGRFEISGNGPMIVSRGIGCSNIPLRLNSDPELIICRLQPEAAGSVVSPGAE